jgi:Distinct helicase family with a unique C-terminal domain including a metal-binding cysteine cluster
MRVEKKTRAIGIAIGELFKKAYVSHQGVVYEVDTIDNGGKNLYPDEETYRRMRRRLELFHPDFVHFLKPFPRRKPGQSDFDYFQEIANKIKIIVPKKISCKITPELKQFRCVNTKCGWFGPISFLNDKRQCPECKSTVVQAPIYRWDIKKGTVKGGKVVDDPDRYIIGLTNPPCKKHGGKKVFHRLVPTDFKTPIASMRLYCPECGNPTSGRRLVRKNYKLGLPTTSIRRKIMISQVDTKDPGSWRQMEHCDLLSSQYVEGVYYSENIKLYQITFGYSYETEHCFPLDDAAIGREFKTQGIVIQLKPDIYEKLLAHVKNVYRNDPEIYAEFMKDLERLGKEYYGDPEDEQERVAYNRDQLKRWVLHTLKHAFLMMLPLKTGLDFTKFAGSYDIDDDRIIIYDNEFGGIGGCQLLSEDQDLFLDYLEITRKRLQDCDCRSRCLKCLVTNYCGEVNNALNRHLIGPIFSIETDYE